MQVTLSLDGHESLSVRHFSIAEAMSSPFHGSVVGTSPHDDMDLDALSGAPVTLTVEQGGTRRVWGGIAQSVAHVSTEQAGLSSYQVSFVPRLWLLDLVFRSRIYQHLSVPEIVQKVCKEHDVPVRLQLGAQYPKHEYRVAHGETALAFIDRLLEEAGVAYHFAHDDDLGEVMVLTDAAQTQKPSLALRYFEEPNNAETAAYVTELHLTRSIGPGAHEVRDHDFQKHAGHKLTHRAGGGGAEAGLTHSHYQPGTLQRGDKPADVAQKAHEADRAHLKIASFVSTSIALEPGVVFTLKDHPRTELGADKPLLCTEVNIDGDAGGDVHVRGTATPASVPHRPAKKTARPHVSGIESATVVGPKGESIHTDAHGRVKIQLAWDHEGGHDETSSCWVRVSQAWAGAGYGMVALPRVGQEVLVAFLGGDPDQPVVIGRVFNAENAPPYKLPENKTKTGIKTASVPFAGDAAFNEISFEDKRGAELLSIQAERDLEILVKGSETERTGTDRTLSIGQNQSITVGAIDSTLVGKKHSVAVTAADGTTSTTRIDMSDSQIVCTTGLATVTFDGPDLTLEAQGNVTIIAHDGDVVIKGGPNVKINC